MTRAVNKDHEARSPFAESQGTVDMDLQAMAPPCKVCQEVTLVGMVQNIFFLLVKGRIARSIQTSSSFQEDPP